MQDPPVLHKKSFCIDQSETPPDSALERCLLNAAKILIPSRWKTTTSPSLKDWLGKVNELAKFEELSARTERQNQSFRDTWLRWFLFRDSDTYKQHSQGTC
ncbi:hypothetical protein XELAEV_18007466mg [Xenopus laevis]|uniref:Uncharacterized protein n=1 Tax=Xenopus laevis TaxID=8355 RepID=A0A974I5E0_XENLA|nr:hypothetical protein XELAEV_18007466mg [Xenopus laevis]